MIRRSSMLRVWLFSCSQKPGFRVFFPLLIVFSVTKCPEELSLRVLYVSLDKVKSRGMKALVQLEGMRSEGAVTHGSPKHNTNGVFLKKRLSIKRS